MEGQEAVIHLSDIIVEPASGTTYSVLNWIDLLVTGMPPGLSFDSDLPDMEAGQQTCLSYSGTPLDTGLFVVSVTGEMVISFFGNPINIGEFSSNFTIEILSNPDGISGCTYSNASNYLAFATDDDGSCLFFGCTDQLALNFSPLATMDDGTCLFDVDLTCPSDLDGDGLIGTGDLLTLLTTFGAECD